MKNALTLLAFLCLYSISVNSSAQYTITPIAPPPSFTFNDLWHFTVIRSAADNNAQFYISLRVFDASNILKVKSNTAVLALPTGSHYFNTSNISQLEPFITSYYDASVLQQIISSGGTFPPGTYNIVYTLYGKSADGEFAPLSEDASEAIVEAMWPPMLLSPPDEDTIDTQYPILTWTPAFSSSYNGQITYTLNLVELYPGQNGYQAIQANPLYFSQNDIPITMLPYPPSAQVLDTTKVYAWQVHADAQGTAMGSSEVWTFTWGTPQTENEPIKSNKIYFDIKRASPFEKYIITDGFLYIKYEEEYAIEANEMLTFQVLDKNYTPKNTTELSIPIYKGTNRIKINQCELKLGEFKDKDFFYFKAKNQKGETFLLKFYPSIEFTCQ